MSSSSTKTMAETLNQKAIERLKRTFERTEQMHALRRYYDNVVEKKQRQQLILISGESGTGKTILASSLRSVIEEQGGLYLQGKFDQYQKSSQSAIAAAFCQTSQLIKRPPKMDVEDIKDIVKMIPGLADFFGYVEAQDYSDCMKTDMNSIKSRSMKAFLRFVAAISSESGPVVLFLDDLQWAAKADYDFISDILHSPAIQRLVVVGACRVVAKDHELSSFLRDLSHRIAIKDVVVSNLTPAEVEEYLSTSIFIDSDCRSLSHVVFEQTLGNFFFMKEWLVNMIQDGHITSCNGELRCELEPQSESVDEKPQRRNSDVIDFVALNLRRLPQGTQELIKAASCLGVAFSSDSLTYAVSPRVTAEFRVEEDLVSCLRRGILVPTSSDHGLWGFAHDRMQQAAYELIPESERPSFHLSIGRALQSHLTKKELDANILLVTGQLTVATELIPTQQERDAVATLCLCAGQRLVATANFEEAGSFIDKGLSLLGDDKWRTCYDLCLQLHNAAAELSYVSADFDKLELLSNEVFQHARTFEDTLDARTNHVYALGSQHKLDEAVQEGLAVLEKLGEPLRKYSLIAVMIEHERTKRRLSKLTDRGFLSLPPMKDPNKLAATRLTNLLYSYLFWRNDPRALLLTYKSLQMSMKYGITGMSAVSLVFYASYTCAFGKIEQGVAIGRLALRVVDRFHARQWSGRVHTIFNSFVIPWKDPPAKFLKGIQFSQKTCFDTGDIEYAVLAQGLEVSCRVWNGQALEECYQRCIELQENLTTYKQHVIAFLFAPILQATANFMGKADRRLILTGKFMNEEEAIANAKGKGNFVLVLRMMYTLKTELAFWDNQFDTALKFVKEIDSFKTQNMAAGLVYMELFYGALTRLVVTPPDVRGAKSNIRQLRAYAKTAPTVITHWVAHLEAELAFVNGKLSKAIEKFEVSIACSQRAGLIHYQALACERAAVCFACSGMATESDIYLNEALSLYQQWGCPWKVEKLLAKSTNLAVRK